MRRVTGLRRRAVVSAAMAAVLGMVPALTAARHRYLWIAFVCIGLQILLIVLALSFLARARRSGQDRPQQPAR